MSVSSDSSDNWDYGITVAKTNKPRRSERIKNPASIKSTAYHELESEEDSSNIIDKH